MAWICGQLRMLGSVAIIMICAAGGTIGIMNGIQKVFHGYPKKPVSKKPEDAGKKTE